MPIRAAAQTWNLNQALGCAGSSRRHWRWSVNRPVLVSFENLERLLSQGRSEVDQIVRSDSLNVERRGLCWKRLRRGSPLSLRVRLRDRTLFNRPNRFAADAVEGIGECLLRHLNDSLHGSSIHCEIEQDRMRRHVVVPDVVMHHTPALPVYSAEPLSHVS